MTTKKSYKAITSTILLIAVLCVGMLFVASCGKSPATKATTSANTTSSKTTKVADADGTFKVLPVVGIKGEIAPVNTVHDPRTPATFNPFTHNNTPVLVWGGLVQAVNAAHATQYINAVNDRARATGFNWADIQKWSVDPRLKGTYTLTIQVFGSGFSDAEARNIAAELVGRKLADVLPIVPHPAGILINTRSIGNGQVGDFLDVRSMVRVSLSPVVINKKGNLVVGRNSGIFTDCFNIWRLGRVVKHHAKTPGKTPAKHNKHKKHHKRLARKVASQDPAAQGNAPVGGGKNKNPGPGKKTSKPAKPSPTPRTNPPTPSPIPSVSPTTIPGGSTPDPAPAPSAEPSAPTPTNPGGSAPPTSGS
jgi:hypothetical protein